MGVNLKDIIVRRPVSIEELAGKKFSVDGHNALYQFLATIRQPDGSPLKDSQGRITSHLNGLFNRVSFLMRSEVKLAFVFDGKVPDLKSGVLQKRKDAKIEAERWYQKAKEEQNLEDMKKYAARTTRLTPEMIGQAKELLDLMGVPWIQAPSEGEAQAAFMAKEGDVFAAVSQDYDTLLFEAPRLVQNLSVSARKKVPGKLSFQPQSPQMISLKEVYEELKIGHKQLVALSLLVGTDYCQAGVRGIGPKKALALVQKHGNDVKELFAEVKWEQHVETPWEEIYNVFERMPVTKEYSLKWKQPNLDKLKEFLIDRYSFSKERVESALDKLEEYSKTRSQRSLADF